MGRILVEGWKVHVKDAISIKRLPRSMDKVPEEEPNCSVFFSLIKIEGAFRSYPLDFLIRNVFDIGQSRVLSYSGYRIVKPDTRKPLSPIILSPTP